MITRKALEFPTTALQPAEQAGIARLRQAQAELTEGYTAARRLVQERAAIELDENGDVRPQTTPLPTAVVSGRSSVATLGAKEGPSAARRWPRQAACVGASPVAAF